MYDQAILVLNIFFARFFPEAMMDALLVFLFHILLPQVQTLNFGDVLFGSSRWTNMSKHLIFRGSCEDEYYHPHFVSIIRKFGISPQVFASTVPIAKARRSLSMHASPVLL